MRAFSRRSIVLVACFLSLLTLEGRSGIAGEETPPELAADRAAAIEADVTQGALRVVAGGDAERPDISIVECPLEHTDVKVEIAGFIARVNVTQTFRNPRDERIEAVYVFPLPHEAAVDAMTMVVGERRIVGAIKKRQEARAIYEDALEHGQTAALLEQERPNIFTQSVGNIEPGQEVRIEISYVDVLKYDLGSYEFHFPMVVGPRYIPGGSIGSPADTPAELAGKVSPPVADTDRVPDASRISPPVLKPEVRTGHDVSLSVTLDAGVPIQDLSSGNHAFTATRDGDTKAEVTMSPADSLPNKDFLLRYNVVGKQPEMALLTHTGKYSGDAARSGEGYFLMMIQPSEDEKLTKAPPREIVFLVDVSGSMSGEPTEKVKEAMRNMLALCRENDTVQVVTFFSDATKLFDKPLPATKDTIRRAMAFSDATTAGGGTEMLKGVQLAIDEPLDPERVRIVVMLTDGLIGNEAEIIEHVGKKCGDKVRFWCVGIGPSPNMFLVDGVAAQGGGMGKRLGFDDDSADLTTEIMTRIQRAQLANIHIDWSGLEVSETYPAKIPELWAGRPVMILGRYLKGDKAEVTVHGTVEGEPVEWPLTIELPANEPSRDSLAKAWARRKIDDLMMHSSYAGSPAIEEEVTSIALDYKLMSQYTSFVAVDSTAPMGEPAAKPPHRMLVPVPLPEGTMYEGFYRGDILSEFESSRVTRASVLYGTTVQTPTVAITSTATTVNVPDGGTVLLGGIAKIKGRTASYSIGSPVYSKRPPGSIPYTVTKPTYGAPTPPQNFNASARNTSSLMMMVAPRIVIQDEEELSVGKTPNRTGWYGQYDRTFFLFDRAGAARGDWAIEEQQTLLEGESQKSLDAANEHAVKKSFDRAEADFSRAYLLALAAKNSGDYASERVAAEALRGIEETHARQVELAATRQPRLAARLDLTLEDVSLPNAVTKIAAAANLPIELVEGSEADARSLVGEGAARVNYLDLRGATVAQALDWVLMPARLTWRLDEDRVIAGSQRRMAGPSAWIYDVAAMALPTRAEEDADKDLSATIASLDAFRNAAANVRPSFDPCSVVWYAPGQLLVFGPDREHHVELQRFFDNLADKNTKLTGQGERELQAAVVARLAAKKDEGKKQTGADRQLGLVYKLYRFDLPLLAAAADGKLDREAFVELSIAWRDEAMTDLLAGNEATNALSSLWMITQAAQALPEEVELRELAAHAAKLSQPAADAALATLEKNPSDAPAFGTALCAALAKPAGDTFRRRFLTAIAKSDETLDWAPAILLAKCLLDDADKIDRAALEKQIAAGEGGEMEVLLLALACRRAGGEVWTSFRASAHDVFKIRQLRPEIVVLVSKLGSANPLLSAARP